MQCFKKITLFEVIKKNIVFGTLLTHVHIIFTIKIKNIIHKTIFHLLLLTCCLTNFVGWPFMSAVVCNNAKGISYFGRYNRHPQYSFVVFSK